LALKKLNKFKRGTMASEHDEKLYEQAKLTLKLLEESRLPRLYQEAKVALKLLDELKLPRGQLYALECIAEGKEIKIHTPPSTHQNADYEKHALHKLSTAGYKSLTKEDAMREYISFVKMLLQNNNYNEVCPTPVGHSCFSREEQVRKSDGIMLRDEVTPCGIDLAMNENSLIPTKVCSFADKVIFANKILIDESISAIPKVTSNSEFF
jgi:acyl-CoA-binding protein